MNPLNQMRIMLSASGNGDVLPKIGQRPETANYGSDLDNPTGKYFRRWVEEIHWFEHSTHRHPFPGINRPVHLLQLSDVHIREECTWLDELCEHIKGLSPDLIFLTGDVVTRGWTNSAVSQFLSALPKAPMGIFAILGNWEHWTDATADIWGPLLKAHGVRLLVNELVDFPNFTLVGTDDHLAGIWEPQKLCSKLPEKPVIALTHSPGAFNELSKFPINLTLAGHAHGGQIRLPFLGPLWTPKGTDGYISGWYFSSGSTLFVSRGIGWSVAPIRWLCPPEIVSIFLVPHH